MSNWITYHAVHAGCRIDLVNAIGFPQRACGDLSRSSLLARIGRPEGEDASCADAKEPADDALFSHAKSDHRALIALLLQELHRYNVVVKRIRGAYDFEEVGWIRLHLGKRFFQFLR